MRSLVLFACILATPAFAGASDWQELAPGARARLISADEVTPQGSILVGIEIDMPAETKTYWRVPGETGIPANFDLGQSWGVGEYRVLWPYPEIDQSTGYLDYVYRGPTVLPIELAETGVPMDIDMTVVLGICSDICVPVEARFVLSVRLEKPDAGQALRLQQAVANVPVAPPTDTVIGAATLAAEGLSVAVEDPEIDPASIIAATADPAVVFGAPKKSPDNNLVILPLLGGGQEQSLVGQLIEISFMTPTGPYVVERKIAAAGSTSAAP